MHTVAASHQRNDSALISQFVNTAKFVLPGLLLAFALYHFGTAYLLVFAALSVLGMAVLSRIDSIQANEQSLIKNVHYSDGGTFKKPVIKKHSNARPVVSDGGSFSHKK